MSTQVVVITGGAGFLGSHLCDWFINKGYRVIAVDNLITGSRRNIAHLINNKKFTFMKHDICKPFKVAGRVDYVLDFASPASPVDFARIPLEIMDVGSAGTKNSLELAKVKKASFLLASTSEVYGDPLVHPQKESYWGNVNPNGPRSVYDEAKRFSEALTFAYHRVHGVKVKIVRIFNTYGQRMQINDGRVVPNFIDQILRNQPLTVYGTGKQTRSFCYIDDLVDGLITLMDSEDILIGPFNLGNTHEIKILELAEIIFKLLGKKKNVIFKTPLQDDPPRRCPDIDKARTELNWEPRVSLEDGLKETIKYFKMVLNN